MPFSKQEIQKLVIGNFKNEEEMEGVFIQKIGPILNISQDRIRSQVNATFVEGTHSKRPDVVIVSEGDSDQILITIELKLHKSIRNYHNNSYEDATKQLHNYCQYSRSPIGILLSDEICRIYEYRFHGSSMEPQEINELPDLKRIEEESAVLNKLWGEVEKLKEDQSIDREKQNHFSIIITGILVLILAVFFYKYNSSGNCQDIKGNITYNNGVESKIYHTKESAYYERTRIDPSIGEKIFCNEKEAVDAGFRKYIEYVK